MTHFSQVCRDCTIHCRVEAEKGTEKRERLPISPDILRKIKGVWESAPPDPDTYLHAVGGLPGVFCFLEIRGDDGPK